MIALYHDVVLDSIGLILGLDTIGLIYYRAYI